MQIVRGISVATLCLLMQSLYAQAPQEGNDPATAEGVHDELGVLIMAHGGRDGWNDGVLESVRPLREFYNLEVAFGMADAVSLQKAVDRLESRGAQEIAVVRLFISGESWYERTRQILGLAEGAPEKPSDAGESSGEEQEGPRMAFWEIESDARFRMSQRGLVRAEEMGDVLQARARQISRNPAQEDVLILAHGPGDDAENERWLQYMDARASALRNQGGFYRVRVATLREDWPEKREAAEQTVRDFVRGTSEAGRTALVLPFRVHGFGPYHEALEGLDYVANENGLIPHPAVTRWIVRQVQQLHSP